MVTEPKRAGGSSSLIEACSVLVRRRRGGQVSEDAEDAVQDACVRALQINSPRIIHDPVRYLMRMTGNLFKDYNRRRARDSRLFEQSDDLSFAADKLPNPERLLADKQILACVLAAIEELPPRCREAFLLHRFENHSYPVIARRMGISISMVEKHIAEAMLRLGRARDAEIRKT